MPSASMRICLSIIALQLIGAFDWKSLRSPSKWAAQHFENIDVKKIQKQAFNGLLAFNIGLELYVRLPQALIYGSVPVPVQERGETDSMVLIFPGAGGPDIHTDHLKEAILSSDHLKGVKRYVDVYDWGKWRSDFFRIAFDGEAVGKRVCSQLARDEKKLGPLHHLHVIGVSVGSFAADSCVQAYKQASPQPGMTRVTFLDPFTLRGVFGYGWGLKHFGEAADISEQYLNTDDPVPTTNDRIQNAFTYDVTHSKLKKLFVPSPGDSFHSWPVEYLITMWTTDANQRGEILEPSVVTEPKGGVVEVE